MGRDSIPDATPTEPCPAIEGPALGGVPGGPVDADTLDADPYEADTGGREVSAADPSLVDVVPGDPPVPVTVWWVPAADAGRIYERLVTRLLAAYTRRGQVVFDAGCDPALGHVAAAAGRRHRADPRSGASGEDTQGAPLAVAEWPLLRAGLDPVIVLGGLRRRLRPGGCLAVIVASAPPGQPPTELGPLVGAARTAGLIYLQHVVAVHARADGDTLTPQPAIDPVALRRSRRGGAAHLRIHTDVLVFTHPGGHDG